MPFSEQLDYFCKLSAQFPASATKSAPSVRVICAASGTLPAAAVLSEREAVLEHALYWAATGKREAQYLTAILNSEAARSRVAAMQSRGQWGARHFDKLMFELPIPLFNVNDPLHRELAAAAERAAEQFAARRTLSKKTCTSSPPASKSAPPSTTTALRQEIEELVTRLLD